MPNTGASPYAQLTIEKESRLMLVEGGANDDKKNESMDIGQGRQRYGGERKKPSANFGASHHLMTLTMDGKLYRAPLKKNIKVIY